MPLQSSNNTSDPIIKRLSSLFRTIPYTSTITMPHHLHTQDQRQGFYHKGDAQHHGVDDGKKKEKKKRRKRVCEEVSSDCRSVDEKVELRESSCETLDRSSLVHRVVPSWSSGEFLFKVLVFFFCLDFWCFYMLFL